MVPFSKVIMIDDDPTNNQLCKMVFMRTYPKTDFIIYEDGWLALKALKADHAIWKSKSKTVILLDVDMPHMDGWEFLEEYSQLSDEVKQNFHVFILSSSSSPKDVERAKGNPLVKRYFVKPLKHWIIEEIEQLMNNASVS